MAADLTKIPPFQLKARMNTPKICIRYKKTTDSEYKILFSSFPRAVAATFSTVWAEAFPSCYKPQAGALQKSQPTIVTLTGGHADAHKSILQWMLKSCDGRQGVRAFKSTTLMDNPLYNTYLFKEAASIIGCTYLEKEFDQRMDWLCKRQLHSADVQAFWLYLPADHELRTTIAKNIAIRIFNKELRGAGFYFALRQELSNFDEAINAVIEPLIALRNEERYAERQKERDERWEKIREQRRQEAGRRRAEAKQKQKQEKEQVAKQGNDTNADNNKVEEAGLKKVVPGTEQPVSLVCFMKNKAAKQRQKRREEKAAAVEETQNS
jgi:hypothetical protein